MTQCTHPPEALLRLPSPEAASIVEATDGLDIAAASECIEKRGFCILRGLFSTADIEAVNSRIKRYFAAPAIAGAPGYWKVDHVKKLLNPFTLGGPVIKFLLDKQVIEVVEKVMKSECILAETVVKFDRASSYTYFPLHIYNIHINILERNGGLKPPIPRITANLCSRAKAQELKPKS